MSEDPTLGKIEVSPRAIASIASEAVLRCYGVDGMAAATLRDGLAELLQGDSYHRGVEAKLVSNRIAIDLYVVIEYGTRISSVAKSVANNVKFNVEKMLGIPVNEVNVHVRGLRVSDAD